jgi:eukaryotic-like serine/threonine-protein kinase
MSIERLRTIYTEAAAISLPEERAVFLKSACAGDPALRQQVDELLAAREKVGDFLETPLVGAEVVELIGSRIGPYKILEQIGEGGFGIVYMAEQEQPVRRKVALKLIKAGMDTKQVIARFEAERQGWR